MYLAQVAPHLGRGTRATALVEYAEQRAVAVCHAHRLARCLVQCHQQGTGGQQLFEHAHEQRVAAQAGQLEVERSGEADRLAVPAAVGGHRFGVDDAAQRSHLRARQLAGEPAHHLAFDDAARVEHECTLGTRRLGHLRAAIGPQQDHAVLREPVQRLAHEGARHRKGPGQLFFAQTRAGPQPVVNDGPIDRFVDAVRGLRLRCHRCDAGPGSALLGGDRCAHQAVRRRARRPIHAAEASATAITSREMPVVKVPSA